MNARFLLALLALSLSLALSACGNKGPLVLPSETDAVEVDDDGGASDDTGDAVIEEDADAGNAGGDGDPAGDGGR